MNNIKKIQKRDKSIVDFDRFKITSAIKAAVLSSMEEEAFDNDEVDSFVVKITHEVCDDILNCEEDFINIEFIQDSVEKRLMLHSSDNDSNINKHAVARNYAIYRSERAKLRDMPDSVKGMVEDVAKNIKNVSTDLILKSFADSCHHSNEDLVDQLLLSVRQLFDRGIGYSYVAARLLLKKTQKELKLSGIINFKMYLNFCVGKGLLSKALLSFDLDKIESSLDYSRDDKFKYIGFKTLYDRYLINLDNRRIELPQWLFMRVAMGLAINEGDGKNDKAIEFYNALSSFDMMCSTPTLFNSGTNISQLSSCFISTVPDDLEGIFNAIRDNALMQKWAGGIGNDWSYVRGMGAMIKGTNGKSQGLIPFLKVANDTLISVNQGGKRRGSGCAYLESWHIDIEEFLELRKNTGDDRRRTHDMDTANWIPDELMRRVHENRHWTLFSPDEVSELHDLYGQAFSEAYRRYEQQADAGALKVWKQVSAVELWRKMLTMLFETGHPWIAFKEPCNLRSPQQHVGVVHSSNLCTEITLNTSAEEIAVCNLASINLANHIVDGQLDQRKLQHTVHLGMRMLDNVIDINYYSVPQARNANLKHRPVGLGIMGFQDALYQLRMPYASSAAVEFADKAMEYISYYAILASTELAQERGSYDSYPGSLWSQGQVPLDSIQALAVSRGSYLEMSTTATLDWDFVRHQVKTKGMRNSNCMAIAPTATISNICGVSQSIEPTFRNIFIKSNLSGSFTMFNEYLIESLSDLGILDQSLINEIKYHEGSIQDIDRIPLHIKELFKTAFEIKQEYLIECASRRQKWIDQSQSLNLYLANPSGKDLDHLYKLAWIKGLKTTYYLRTIGATNVSRNSIDTTGFCSIDDPSCESCQ